MTAPQPFARRDELIAYCHAKPGAVEDYPFGDEPLVMKVGGRMFALFSLDRVPAVVSLRSEEHLVPEWRARFPDAIGPAPYMGKRAWNLVVLDGAVPDDELRILVDESYDAVVSRLPKSRRPAGGTPLM